MARSIRGLSWAAVVCFSGCERPKPTHVRLAAIQFHSVMGDVQRNRAELAKLVRRAADDGAKVVALPEAAVSGYADLDRDVFWSAANPAEAGLLPAASVAESVDGESVNFFSRLAKERAIYLTVPFVERARGRFFNSAVLLGPDGAVKIHYRKQHLWTVADPSWAAKGDLGTPVVDTEYGRVGVMICYDVNHLLPEFQEQRADIVLHCVAWFGPWFDVPFNKRVREAGVTLVLANWTFPEEREWRGAGATRIIGRDGGVLTRVERDYGNAVAAVDVPIRR